MLVLDKYLQQIDTNDIRDVIIVMKPIQKKGWWLVGMQDIRTAGFSRMSTLTFLREIALSDLSYLESFDPDGDRRDDGSIVVPLLLTQSRVLCAEWERRANLEEFRGGQHIFYNWMLCLERYEGMKFTYERYERLLGGVAEAISRHTKVYYYTNKPPAWTEMLLYSDDHILAMAERMKSSNQPVLRGNWRVKVPAAEHRQPRPLASGYGSSSGPRGYAISGYGNSGSSTS